MKKQILLPIFIIALIFSFSPNISAEYGDVVLDQNKEEVKKAELNTVLFSHSLHMVRYKCKACHKGIIKSEKAGIDKRHKTMKQDKYCGECHNSKIAFSTESPDNCKRCHNYDGKEDFLKVELLSQKAQDKKKYKSLKRDKWNMILWEDAIKSGSVIPSATIGSEEVQEEMNDKDVIFIAKSHWASDTLFSHTIHTYWLNCISCHNDDLFMKDYKKHVEMDMKGMVEGKWCGKCHDKMAFRFADCKRCHVFSKYKSNEKVAKEIKRRNSQQAKIFSIAEARKRQAETERRRREAWEAWLNEYTKATTKLIMISLSPESLEHPGTPEDMVFVPKGKFLRGQDWGPYKNNQPSKEIDIDAFFIDIYELTVLKYKIYLRKIKKEYPEFLVNRSFGGNNQPIYKITWQEAADYCHFYDKRLPTEAEWEKAARGWDNRYFSWGNELPDEGGIYRASYDPGHMKEDGFRYTAETGYFRDDISPYGVMDMTGNIWEWTADWYSPEYYNADIDKNPQGPETGAQKVLRGGGYNKKTPDLLVTNRLPADPNKAEHYIGFRCVQTAE